MQNATDRESLKTLGGERGLLFACVLDGAGGAALTDWDGAEAWEPGAGPLWIHLDAADRYARDWLTEKSGLTPVTVEALLAAGTRPRTFRGVKGVIAILRGVNTNPGEKAHDLISFRIWSDGRRVITLREIKLMTPRDVLIAMVADGAGPKSASALYEALISRLTDRIGGVVADFEEELDAIEATMNDVEPSEARRRLGEARREAVVLRRYMAPQREAVATLHQEPPDWLEDAARLRLRETANRLTQFIEDLDQARERAVVIDDGVANRVAEGMNQNMYVLSIIAAIFLPLGFVTGLLGINVGGMPGVDDGAAFWIACGLMGALIVAELAFFRYLKWI